MKDKNTSIEIYFVIQGLDTTCILRSMGPNADKSRLKNAKDEYMWHIQRLWYMYFMDAQNIYHLTYSTTKLISR